MNEQEIFEAALEHDPQQRTAYLEQVCGDDRQLRQRVEDLLQLHERAGDFFEKPAGEIVATADNLPITESPGTVIGRYKLLEQIGEGGMGVVFMAEQTEPVRRKVALKIIKPGMDTKQVIARFEAERQALAVMDHPNIAKVLDAGTTVTEPDAQPAAQASDRGESLAGASGCGSGRPYFVMELVRGVPITEYCDDKKLDTRERLQLSLQVCQAIQHAHQKGIIHRDIKPSNVIVSSHDGNPVVKVIDFGIAKAMSGQLTDNTLFTGFAQMVGTPLYMSPEQAGMSDLDVDTRSDIYSLGVLMYELLTGTTPFDKERLKKATFDEVRRIIREEEPPRPSARISTLASKSSATEPRPSGRGDAKPLPDDRGSDSAADLATIARARRTDPRKLSQSLHGELDWIVMKALEKDRNRRYESPTGLADDLRRYLADEPVLARPASRLYRFQKYLKRKKGPVIAAASILLVLLIGAAGTALALVRANTAILEKLEGEKEAATRVANELQYDLIQQQIQRTRLTPKSGGWFPRIWPEVSKAGRIRKDQDLKNQAAALLIGLDAQSFKKFDFGVSSVAFDSAGAVILLGGVVNHAASVWKVGLEAPKKSGQAAVGPVAFRQGVPIQLSVGAANARALILTNLENSKTIQTISLENARVAKTRSFSNLVLSKNGKFAGAILVNRENKLHVAVWDTITGKQLKSIPAAATALAFSGNGALLAIGGADGAIQVWNLKKGAPATVFRFGRNPVTALAFGRATVTYGAGEGATYGFLAAGAGSHLRVIDLKKRNVASYCYGAAGGIFAIEFAGDGLTLAAGSRGHANLFDIATGRLLLSLPAGSYVTDVAFSPDSRRLAVGNLGSCRVWAVEYGRGIRTLRGNSTSIYQTRFSADGNFIASLSYDWKILIWHRSGTLLHVFDAPIGITPDNAGMNFSPDNNEFACATGRSAKLWDLKSGALIREWSIPVGLIDNLVFGPKGKIFLFRVDGQPDQNAVLRELKRDGKVATIKQFPWYSGAVFAAEYSPGGEYLVIDGYGGTGVKERQVRLYRGFTGKLIWSQPSEYRERATWLRFDGGGQLLFYLARVKNDKTIGDLIDVKTRRCIASFDDYVFCMTKKAAYYVQPGRKRHGVALYQGEMKTPLLTLGLDIPKSGVRMEFSRDGKHLVWGNLNGMVFVAGLGAVRERLESVDMGW